ncbi:MAG: hypothetical protein JO125_15380 [Chloroflexi bacterium]|nr:hypothetical protein [Ktedonobacteraceae bacterium]MBV9020885.1 hypothetical protein [Ktedonobacteraceae bacterium]MBV9708779.1 hypothetical protein [Chloroflexota bacterium]
MYRITIRLFLFCCLVMLLTSCAGATNTSPTKSVPSTTSPPSPTLTSPTATPSSAPQHYTAHVILRGVDHPDDLVFDNQGRLIFSDARSGLIGRLEANGSVTVLLRGLAVPEGLVVLKDGTLIIAEQGPNRILALAPGATTPRILRVLPGTPSTVRCKDGVDGIALDPTNDTLIIPDSPTGAVYRMSLNGQTLTLLASGITRPVGAAVDPQGTVYVADECGGALWTIAADGKTTRIGGFGMLDDVVLDTHGNVLVTDLAPAIHALIRLNLATGRRETLASRGYIEPQGLVLGPHDSIYLSDDFADVIVQYVPA